MTDNSRPDEPQSNEEKFRPENVADPRKTDEPPFRDADRPADTDGVNIARGSERSTLGQQRR